MFLLFIITLMLIIYFICMEFDEQVTESSPLTGHCPECSVMVEIDWLVCPKCQTLLREACPDCGKGHDRWLNYCPWCGHFNQKAIA